MLRNVGIEVSAITMPPIPFPRNLKPHRDVMTVKENDVVFQYRDHTNAQIIDVKAADVASSLMQLNCASRRRNERQRFQVGDIFYTYTRGETHVGEVLTVHEPQKNEDWYYGVQICMYADDPERSESDDLDEDHSDGRSARYYQGRMFHFYEVMEYHRRMTRSPVDILAEQRANRRVQRRQRKRGDNDLETVKSYYEALADMTDALDKHLQRLSTV